MTVIYIFKREFCTENPVLALVFKIFDLQIHISNSDVVSGIQLDTNVRIKIIPLQHEFLTFNK